MTESEHMQQVLGRVLGGAYLMEDMPDAAAALRYARALDRQMLYRVSVGGAVFALAVVRGDAVVSPASVQREQQRASAVLALPVAVYWPHAGAAQAEELRRLGCSYITPAGGAFLPFLWLRIPPAEWSASPPSGEEPGPLSPCAQVIVLRQLLFGDVEGKNIRSLARLLPYSAALLGRATLSLLAHSLCAYPAGTRCGRFLFPSNAHDLWLQAEPMLRSPVRQRFAVSRELAPPLPAAGISALAMASDLADDPLPTCAYYQRARAGRLQPAPPHAASLRIEKWSYPPSALIAPGARRVDDLSLYLSLREHHDPRVRIALQSLHLP